MLDFCFLFQVIFILTSSSSGSVSDDLSTFNQSLLSAAHYQINIKTPYKNLCVTHHSVSPRPNNFILLLLLLVRIKIKINTYRYFKYCAHTTKYSASSSTAIVTATSQATRRRAGVKFIFL